VVPVVIRRKILHSDVPSIMLDTQYRMHPAISAFPSLTFYNSDLKDGTVHLRRSWISLSNRDVARPPALAASLMITGGNCL
jgi:hypothetical protein